MKPDPSFLTSDFEFWANVKFLSQKVGYHRNVATTNIPQGFVVPTIEQIEDSFEEAGMSPKKLVKDHLNLTEYGQRVIDYFKFRGEKLENEAEPNLMSAEEAKELFDECRAKFEPTCPMPMNKQRGKKKDFSFLTCLVNMHVEAFKGEYPCDYDPMELTAFTLNDSPEYTMSRRVDGAFPNVVNPIAIWEIKEYYYTTTFGSRIADGVYETLLDGMEIDDVKEIIDREIRHFLFIDAYYTWWDMGKSYLCRMVDMLHMGILDEVIIGREVVTRVPEIMGELVEELDSQENS